MKNIILTTTYEFKIVYVNFDLPIRDFEAINNQGIYVILHDAEFGWIDGTIHHPCDYDTLLDLLLNDYENG